MGLKTLDLYSVGLRSAASQHFTFASEKHRKSRRRLEQHGRVLTGLSFFDCVRMESSNQMDIDENKILEMNDNERLLERKIQVHPVRRCVWALVQIELPCLFLKLPITLLTHTYLTSVIF